jgi:PBSX family phage terminase large subunit
MAIWRDPLTPKIVIPPIEKLKETWFQLGAKKFQLLPHQYECLVAKEEVVIMMGGYGCAKTDAGVKKVAHWAMIPNNRIIVGRNAATDLEETTQRDLVDFLYEAELLKEAPNSKNKRAIVHCVDPKTNLALGYTSEISFQHLDDPTHLRGRHIGNYWIDELSEVKKAAHLNLQGRLRLPVQAGRYQCLLTGNPEGQNWGYDIGWNEELLTEMICGHPQCALSDEECNATLRRKRRAIHARSIDNWFLPPSYIENMLANYTPMERRRYMDGEFLVFEGAIFPEFEKDIHVLGGMVA